MLMDCPFQMVFVLPAFAVFHRSAHSR